MRLEVTRGWMVDVVEVGYRVDDGAPVTATEGLQQSPHGRITHFFLTRTIASRNRLILVSLPCCNCAPEQMEWKAEEKGNGEG